MSTKIHKFNFSQILFEPFSALIPSAAPTGFMRTPSAYGEKFEQLAAGGEDDQWTLPWKTSIQDWERYNRFWIRYLESKPLNQIDGNDAWRSLVPFRINAFGRTESGDFSVEGYLYPHGVASLINVYFKDLDVSLIDAVGLAYGAVHNELYDIEWFPKSDAGETSQAASLKQISVEAMQHLRRLALGDVEGVGSKVGESLTVVTIVDGAEGGSEVLEQNSDLHRSLEVFCSWDAEVDTIAPKCQPTTVASSPKRTGDVLYLCERGKVVWYPKVFEHKQKPLKNKKKNASLTCYHRNLSIATLQTESLLKMLELIGESSLPLSIILRTFGQSAGMQIRNLHAGSRRTYRSRGPGHQIEAQKMDVNDVLANRLSMEVIG